MARFRLWPRRSANRDLYRGGNYGYGVIPRLDVPARTQTPIETSLKENPLALGPVWGLAMRMGALPIKTFRINPKSGERSEANDHPGYTILRKPNAVLTRSTLIGGTVLQMLAYDAAMWYKARPEAGGPPGELWPLSPGTFGIKTSKRGLIEGVELRVAGAKRETLPFDDFCYFRLLPDPTDWSAGLAPFRSLAQIADLGKLAVDAASDFFDQGTLGTKWLKTQQSLSPEARERFVAAVQAQRKKKYDWPLLEEDFELRDAGTPPSDEVLVSTMDHVLKIVKETLNLPLDGDIKRLYAEAVQPIADAIEQELERSLFSEWPDDPAFPEFGFREILKGDPLERAKLHQIKVMSAGETPNEGRRQEDLPPLPGGDELYVPLNLVPIGDSVDAETRKKDSSGGFGGDEGKGTLASVRSLRGDSEIRERVIERHAGALATKIDRVLGKERTAIGALPPPSMEEVIAILRRSDKGIERFLAGMMMETANLDRTEELPAQVEALIVERARGVAAVFGAHRLEVVSKAEIGQAYERFASQVPVIAKTETAFAFDLAGTQESSGVQSGA